jgi:hypothetical protein
MTMFCNHLSILQKKSTRHLKTVSHQLSKTMSMQDGSDESAPPNVQTKQLTEVSSLKAEGAE